MTNTGSATTAANTSDAFTMDKLQAAISLLMNMPKMPPPARIVSSTAMVEQYRFPRTKSKRIHKKWALGQEQLATIEKYVSRQD